MINLKDGDSINGRIKKNKKACGINIIKMVMDAKEKMVK